MNAGTLTLAKSHAANPLNFGKAIGGLTINPGSIVRLGDDGQIRDDATVSITSATLDLQSFDDTVGTLNLANASVVGTAGSVLGRLNSDAARTIASTGNSSISTAELFGNGNIPINVPSGTLTISSAITNFGAQVASLTIQGGGAVNLSGANTHTGGITLTASTLFADYASLGTGTLTIDGGWFAISSDAARINNSIVLGSNGAAIDTQGLNPTFFGPVSGGGHLDKVSGGTLYLAANNSAFTGETRIVAGGLMVQHVNALAKSTLNLTSGDVGVLQFHPSISTATIGGLTGSRDLSIQTTSATPIALSVGNNDSNQTYAGAFSGSGSLIKTGSGTLTLSGGAVNTFTGGTIVDQGTLVLNRGVDGAMYDYGVAVGNLTINAGATVQVQQYSQIKNSASVVINGGTLDFAGPIIDSVGSLSIENGSVTSVGGTGGIGFTSVDAITSKGTSSISSLRVIPQVASGDFHVDVINGVLTIPSGLEGSSAGQRLRKTGLGELRFPVGSWSRHDNGSQIDAGKLTIDGLHSSSVTVNSGGTLSGNGTIDGDVSGPGRVAPGDSPGILTINGNYTQAPTSTLEIEVGALTPGQGPVGNPNAGHDQVRVGGVATLDGRYDFPIINGFVPQLNDEITFIDTFVPPGSMTRGSIAVGSRPKSAFVPGLEAANPNLAFRVVASPTDVKLRFVDKGEIFFDDGTNTSANWFVATGWNTDVNPDSTDSTTVGGNITGVSQRVTLNSVDPITMQPLAEVRDLLVRDDISPITVGIDAGFTLASTVGDVKIGDRGAVELNGGTIAIASTQKIDVMQSGILAGNGSVQGSVEVGVAANSSGAMLSPGMETPGSEVGAIDIQGNYTQGAGGVFEVDLQGKSAGQFDTVNVTGGDVQLGGTLRVDVSELASVAAGDSYTLITAPSGSGEFSDFELVDPMGTTSGLYFSQFSGTAPSGAGGAAADAGQATRPAAHGCFQGTPMAGMASTQRMLKPSHPQFSTSTMAIRFRPMKTVAKLASAS